MKRLTGLDSPLWASAVCLLALTLAGAVGITHFDDRNVGFVLLLQALPYAVAAWLIVSGKPDAATVGSPGASGDGCALVAANALNLPDLMWGATKSTLRITI